MKNKKELVRAIKIIACWAMAFIMVLIILLTLEGVRKGIIEYRLGTWLCVGEVAIFAALIIGTEVWTDRYIRPKDRRKK